MDDAVRNALRRYHEAATAANDAPLGSGEYASAMEQLRDSWRTLRAAGIQPNDSWRAREQRKLRRARRQNAGGC
jgi:hypothetical protein